MKFHIENEQLYLETDALGAGLGGRSSPSEGQNVLPKG